MTSTKFIVLSVCLLMLTLNIEISATIETSYAAPNENVNVTDMGFGINYLSTHYHYETHYLLNETIERDFELFNSHGLKYVNLVAVWKYLEPSLGYYNYTALNDLKRVCNYALQYGLSVIIDFHTSVKKTSDGYWTMPDWLSPRCFETVFNNATARGAWLDFLGNCTAYLDSEESIYSWHMMNEPAIGDWACNVTVDEFVELWAEMKNTIRAQSAKPISIRFGAKAISDDFGLDPRIYDLCDYVSLNWYEENCSRYILEENVRNISQHKPVMISEFGYKTDDDQLQAIAYSDYIHLFRSLGIKDCIAWYWRADNDRGDDPPQAGKGYNLAKNLQGEPRPAFLLMENVPPEINNVSQSRSADNVGPNREVRVNASVTDASGVGSVVLNYTVNGTVQISINMTSIEQDSWNCAIPAFSCGTNVSYVIVAHDKAGNVATSEEYRYEVGLLLAILANAYGSHCANYHYQEEPASPNWNPNADLNNDGIVRLQDLVLLAVRYRQDDP
ncbi:MAG: cellulase family glycosylhydrolase [Candidatus Bathyarchaeia archaeon]